MESQFFRRSAAWRTPAALSKSALYLAIVVSLCFVRASHLDAAEPRDGRLFDPGVRQTEPAEGAPKGLAALIGSLGDWTIEMELHQPDGTVVNSNGIAQITFMNRGHAYMERAQIENFDGEGNSIVSMAFVVVDANGAWSLGEADSWSESISIYSGELGESGLVLRNAVRFGGGPTLVELRRSYDGLSVDEFTMRLELSTDGGKSWAPRVVRRYTRAQPTADFFPTAAGIGHPAAGLPKEAREFDLVLGEFAATHWMNLPTGPASWVADATGVHALDGHGILEFNWFNLNPAQPDSATSILRIYNRSMRRWESLYLNNRSPTLLHFGGVREESRIVLHPFAMQTGSNPLSQWIFHDHREDAYRWKGLRSQDRGKTWNLYWGIDFQRKGVEANDLQIAQSVSTHAADGVEVFGDHYRPPAPAATTVVLFHQAGGDGRGEYQDIARRLVDDGFEVFLWDARVGGDRFGGTNRTMAALPRAGEGYCSAYPDLEAALDHAFIHGSGGPIYAVGSSYSAALVIRLAAEHSDRLAGVIPFSPAGGRMEECAVETWLPKVDGVKIAPFRPESEMENESVIAQAELFREHGLDLYIAKGGVHGASMLDPSRSQGDVEPTWEHFLTALGQEE